jgi:hypothetical protein
MEIELPVIGTEQLAVFGNQSQPLEYANDQVTAGTNAQYHVRLIAIGHLSQTKIRVRAKPRHRIPCPHSSDTFPKGLRTVLATDLYRGSGSALDLDESLRNVHSINATRHSGDAALMAYELVSLQAKTFVVGPSPI